MTEIKITRCMNCGSGMEWEYHHFGVSSEPEPPEPDYWHGKCSDCGFYATVDEQHDPDDTIGKWQTRNQLTAFRERKNAPKPKRKPRKAVDTSGMSEDELRGVLGF